MESIPLPPSHHSFCSLRPLLSSFLPSGDPTTHHALHLQPEMEVLPASRTRLPATLSAVLILAGFSGTETVGKAKPLWHSPPVWSQPRPGPEGGLQSGWPQNVRNSFKSQASTMLTS